MDTISGLVGTISTLCLAKISYRYCTVFCNFYVRRLNTYSINYIFAPSNKPKFPGEAFHQTYPTAVKGHYGGIVSRSV